MTAATDAVESAVIAAPVPSMLPPANADIRSRGDHSSDLVQVIEFQLAGARYGVDARWVREVSALENLTPLPCTPAFVAGIVNLRGEILPVVDLAVFFGLAETGLADLHQIIVLESVEMRFGILTRSVFGVHARVVADLNSTGLDTTGLDTTDLDATGVATAPTAISALAQDYLLGATADGAWILDGEKLLLDPRIIVNEGVDT